MIFVEIKGQSFSKGTLVKLFSPHLLRQDWTQEAVDAINRSLSSGTWAKVGKIEIRATKVRSKDGYKRS